MRSGTRIAAASTDKVRDAVPEGRGAERRIPVAHPHRRAIQVARTVAVFTFLGATIPSIAVAIVAEGLDGPALILSLIVAAFGAAAASFYAVRRASRRIDAVTRFFEQRIVATNSVARRATETSEREHAMAVDLARKTEELEQRLRERALLFDVVRESVSSHDLESVLRTIAERLGPALRFREVAILLKGHDQRLTVRTAWGFQSPDAVLGRSVAMGEGLAGEAAATGASVHVTDVQNAPDYLAFWGEVPRSGSFLSVPITFQGELIGTLALTRPADDPLTELEHRFVDALADQAALAIRNAQLFEELELRSTHDALTGLPNRRLFEERLALGIADARRYGHALSLLAIDVDHFKLLNDRWGHPIGDVALTTIGGRLAGGVREVDTVARIGGEEFAILLTRADSREATKVAEKLRHEIAALDADWVREQPAGHLSISVGVTELQAGDDVASLIARADAALYRSKRRGRDRVSTFPPTPEAPKIAGNPPVRQD